MFHQLIQLKKNYKNEWITWLIRLQLEQLAETDEHEAMRQFIILKNFANKEYHVLTLQKNEAAVNSNVHLSNYRGFFTHLHFTAGKMPLRLLHWNLDEFHQANIGFRL